MVHRRQLRCREREGQHSRYQASGAEKSRWPAEAIGHQEPARPDAEHRGPVAQCCCCGAGATLGLRQQIRAVGIHGDVLCGTAHRQHQRR